MKTIKRWLWLILVIVAVAVLGVALMQNASRLRPVTTRVLPEGTELLCNADGYPVMEELTDPSFDPSLFSYTWNRPIRTVWLDDSGKPGREIEADEIRAISPTGDYIAWLDRSWSRGNGSGAGSIVMQDNRGLVSRMPVDYLPGDLYRDGPRGKERSYPRLLALDNRRTIVLGDRSTLCDQNGEKLLSFHCNDYTTQFADFRCSNPRYIPVVHGANLWTKKYPAHAAKSKFALYDTQTGKEIELPLFHTEIEMVLVRDDYLIYLQRSGQARVVERATGKWHWLGDSWSEWQMTADGDTCWAGGMENQKYFAVLQWKTGKPKMVETRIPVVTAPAARCLATLRQGGELAAVVATRPGGRGELAGRRTLTLYRRGRRAGSFTAQYATQGLLDHDTERLAFSPDGKHLAWIFDRGDGNRSLYVFEMGK